MEGTWPVIINGVECGSVSAHAQGAYSVFSVEATYTGGMVRLSLYGGGREGYLGVLAPDGDGLVKLKRRFTRSELAAFPPRPEYAAEAGITPPGRPEQDEDASPEAAADRESGEPDAAPPEPGGELWFASPDGTLSRFEGGRLLVALPSENVHVPDWASGVVRRINGREYVVFPR